MSDLRNDQHGTPLAGHEYDGIVELDNPTPRWWTITWMITIVFGLGYLTYYELMGGPTIQEELQVALKPIQERQQITQDGGVEPAQLEAMAKDPEVLAKGREIFVGKCLACHGDKGQGLVGPNLTDNFWIHGDGTAAAIFTVVKTGVADKGMPPWGLMLKAEELMQATAFVRSLRGTNPAGAKAPQGTEQHEPVAKK